MNLSQSAIYATSLHPGTQIVRIVKDFADWWIIFNVFVGMIDILHILQAAEPALPIICNYPYKLYNR